MHSAEHWEPLLFLSVISIATAAEGVMFSPEDCRKRAQQCVDQAKAATHDADKRTLLRLAQDWLALASEQEKVDAMREYPRPNLVAKNRRE